MKYSDIFLELPRILSNDEFNYYFKLFKEGDMGARDVLIKHNIRLVLSVIQRKFSNTDYELEELFSIGIIGLIKAIDSFNNSKNSVISTYAFKCIQNEILMFLRKNNVNVDIVSLESPINDIDDVNPIMYGELIVDDNINLEDDYIEKDFKRQLIDLIGNTLSDREKSVLMLYFGFVGERKYLQEEISKILNIPRTSVSKILNRGLKKIKNRLLQDDVGMGILENFDYMGLENGLVKKLIR